MSYIQSAKNYGEYILNASVPTSGVNGHVLTIDSTTPSGFSFAANAGVSAGPNITIDSITNPLIPAISVANPLNAVLNLGTQNITGTSSQLDFTLGDLTTLVQAGQVLNNNTSGAGSAVLTNLQLDISDQAGDVLSTLNRDQLVIFNQTVNNEFTATLTKQSLTLTDNALTDSMVLNNNTLSFTDTGNGAVCSLNADGGLLLKPLPFTASGTELTYSKFEMIELDGAGSTSSRLIDTTASTSYDRMRFETPTGLFTDNEKECSLSQSFNTTEYNDPVSTIQTFTRSDADATQGRFRVLYNESTIPIVNNSAITITPSQAELSQNISNLTGANATQITTNADTLAIFTAKEIDITSTNMFVDTTKLRMTSFVASTANPMLELVSTRLDAGATLGTPTIKTQETKNAQTNDIIMSQQFHSKNFNGVDTQFGGIECRASTATAGDTDGSLDFYNTINGVLQMTFRMNGADNENNTFRPLDLNGNSLKTSATNLTIDASTSTGNGVITLATKNATGGLAISGDKTQSNTAGGNSGEHLVITLNGVQYKIKLELP